jgi:hypothetical protein
MTGWHESRLWDGKDKERFEDCDCPEQACGYVEPTQSCPQHSMGAGKSLRRAHPADQCGGVNHHPARTVDVMPTPVPVRTER